MATKKSNQTRRALFVESLETRRLLNSDWQSPVEPSDVNSDSFVSPIDILIVINDLRKGGTRGLGTRPTNSTLARVDVSGDGLVSPIDALLVINFLKSRNAVSVAVPSANTKVPENSEINSKDFLNLKSLGAKGDGVTDDLDAIEAALMRCRVENKRLYVPAGNYLHSAAFSIESQEVFGDGDASSFIAIDPMNAAIYLKGTSPILRSVSHVIQNGSVLRQSDSFQASVVAWECTDFVIDSVTIIGGTSAGILSYGGTGNSSTPAKITNCRVSNTLADAIHLTNGSQWILVENCISRNTGDDGIAVVSYARNTQISGNIVIRNNDVGDVYWGRGITVDGGVDVLIENNTITRTESAGIFVYSELSWNTLGVQRVVVRNNRLVEVATSPIKWHPGILIGGDNGYIVENVTIEGNTITRPTFDGIRVESSVKSIQLSANTVTGLNDGREAIKIFPESLPYVSVS